MSVILMIFILGESNSPLYFPELNCTIIKGFSEINAPDSPIIIGKNPPEFLLKNAFAVIAEENFPGAVPKGIQLITCGISGKNTFSLTSRRENKVTVSLNRNIYGKHGVIEPLEIPVTLRKNTDETDCMIAVACLLLQ